MSVRTGRLDEIENAHRSVGGTGPGRRYATQQINQAYAVLLSSQFQGFSRDLHTECADYLVRVVSPASMRLVLKEEFLWNRKLDQGNPTPGNLGIDFGRLGIEVWPELEADDARNSERKIALNDLCNWRNAIAHQHFDPVRLGGTTILRLESVRAWRSVCEGLARSFDRVMKAHIQLLTGASPW